MTPREIAREILIRSHIQQLRWLADRSAWAVERMLVSNDATQAPPPAPPEIVAVIRRKGKRRDLIIVRRRDVQSRGSRAIDP